MYRLHHIDPHDDATYPELEEIKHPLLLLRGIEDDQLDFVFHHYNDQLGLLISLQQLNYKLPWTSLHRLNSWFKYINTNYEFFFAAYDYLIEDLIILCEENELFNSQTKHEQEISFSFLDYFLHAENRVTFSRSCSYLILILALYYSKHYGYVVRSVKKEVEKLPFQLMPKDLTLLFNRIYKRYDENLILVEYISQLNENETQILTHLIQGKSLRTYPELPYPISKRENNYFFSDIGLPPFDEDFFLKNYLKAKLLAYNNIPESLVYLLLQQSHHFKNRPELFLKHINTWRHFLMFLKQEKKYYVTDYENYEEVNINNKPKVFASQLYVLFQDYPLSHLVDYLEYKLVQDEEYSLKGRNLTSLIRHSSEWHIRSDFEEDNIYLGKVWANTGIKSGDYKFQNDIWIFEEITNGQRLYEEGETMHHCVFSYVRDAMTGYLSIWSIYPKKNEGNRDHKLTLELSRGKHVQQIAGFENRLPTQNEQSIIKLWALKNDIIYEID